MRQQSKTKRPGRAAIGNRGSGGRTRRVDTAYVAIDLHSTTSVLGARDGDGDPLCCWRFPTTGKELVDHVKAVRAREIHLVIEESPMTHWAIGLLRGHCASAISCDPKQNRAIASNSFKGDEEDVDILTRLQRLGELKEVYHTTDTDRFAFKAAVQHYRDMQRDRVRAKNQVKAIMRRVGRHQESKGDRPFAQRRREEILDLMPSPEWRSTLARAYRHFGWLDDETGAALKDASEIGSRYPEIARFQEMPGIGPVGALTFSAFISCPERFPSKSALYRYCGFAITDRSSDGKQLGYERLEKGAGCRELKDVSYHAWLAAVGHAGDNEIKRYHLAVLRTNGGNQRRARLSTQRKILQTLWAMWKHDRPYDPALFLHPADREAATQP